MSQQQYNYQYKNHLEPSSTKFWNSAPPPNAHANVGLLQHLNPIKESTTSSMEFHENIGYGMEDTSFDSSLARLSDSRINASRLSKSLVQPTSSGSLSHKYTKSLLINAPSYVPIQYTRNCGPGPGTGTGTGPGTGTGTGTGTGNSTSTVNSNYRYSATASSSGSAGMSSGTKYGGTEADKSSSTKNSLSTEQMKEELNKLKGEVLIKNQIIKNLTDQVRVMNKNRAKKMYVEVRDDSEQNTVSPLGGDASASASVGGGAGGDGGTRLESATTYHIPVNHYQLFQDLSKTLEEKMTELDETNERLEILLISQDLVQKQGFASGINVEQLSQNLLYKLQNLQQENEELVEMVSFGNTTSLKIENGLLKREIRQLREKLGNRAEMDECKAIEDKDAKRKEKKL